MSHPNMNFNFLAPNGVQVPAIGTRQNNMRPMSNGGCGPTGVQNMAGLGCGGGCGCASCSDGMNGLGRVAVNTLAGVGRRSMRGMTLGQLDDTQVAFATPRWLQVTWGALSVLGTGMGAYHGWKRSHNGWAVAGYALFGMILPVVGIPVMFAQGFAKRK
jgi:hypothetical protein